MKTVICHFYNEEYMLPWWLDYHRRVFDHGIMINYASTDRSVAIIKEMCPTWEVVDSINSNFDIRGWHAEKRAGGLVDHRSLIAQMYKR